MRKVNWKPASTANCYTARVGFIQMFCACPWDTDNSSGYVGSAGTPTGCDWKHGPPRRTLEKAKEDAIQAARELVEGYHTVVVATMKSLGMDIE